MGKGKKMRTEVAEKHDRDTEEHIKDIQGGLEGGTDEGRRGGQCY